ncbi:MAG: squalene/phytoene synthase family protein [Pseudomonadota bacterium]
MQSPSSTESSSEYCLQKAMPEGSNLYYACLFEEDDCKQKILALHAYLIELTSILVECSDPGIARIKFQWWLEELDRLASQQPRHPVTRYIQQKITIDNDLVRQLKRVVQATDRLLLLEQPESLQAAIGIFDQQAGIIWQQCAKFCGNDDSINQVSKMASTYHYLHAILQSKTYVTEACCLIPADYIQKNMIFSMEQFDTEHQESFAKLIDALIGEMDKNLIALDKSDQNRLKHIVILNRIAKKTAVRMRTRNFPWSIDQVSIAPITKLLMAWWIKSTL